MNVPWSGPTLFRSSLLLHYQTNILPFLWGDFKCIGNWKSASMLDSANAFCRAQIIKEMDSWCRVFVVLGSQVFMQTHSNLIFKLHINNFESLYSRYRNMTRKFANTLSFALCWQKVIFGFPTQGFQKLIMLIAHSLSPQSNKCINSQMYGVSTIFIKKKYI